MMFLHFLFAVSREKQKSNAGLIDVWVKTSINPLKYSGHSDEHLKNNYLPIFNYLQGRWTTLGA